MAGDPRQDPRRAAAATAAAATSSSSSAPPPPPPQPVLFQPPPPPPPPPPPSEQQQQPSNILFGGADDDEEDDDDDAMDEDEDVNMMSSSTTTTTATGQQQQQLQQQTTTTTTALPTAVITPQPLPTRILTPSPYPHHTRGATSARFRNALSRVTTHPTSDSEAWAALLTEVQTCRQQLQPLLHSPSVESQQQLDFLVSCYGALLYYFPHAAQHYKSLGDLLLEASAKPGEKPHGPNPHSAVDAKRATKCEAQLETIFQTVLNVQTGPDFGILHKPPTAAAAAAQQGENNKKSANKEQDQVPLEEELQFLFPQDNNNNTNSTSNTHLQKVLGGMGTWSVDLWMLFLQKIKRDLQRHAPSQHPDNRSKWIRDKTVAAYELALSHGAAFAYQNDVVWKSYLDYVKSWTMPNMDNAENDNANDPVVQQQQMIQLRSVYQRLVQLPMTGLDGLWQDYEQFERSHSEELASALITEFTPKYQHARTVYLERARVYNYTGDLEWGRLATPPVTKQKRQGSGSGGVGTGGATGGGGGPSSAATDGAAATNKQDDSTANELLTTEEYVTSLQEEYQLLQAWKKRVNYERTNPERLSSATDLPQRMRHAYLEMVSALTRHPEVWHMWSMYEVHHAHRPVRAMAVLQLGMQHIPDCTLLAYTLAQLVESHAATGTMALEVLDRFLQRSPNTLAFCLYQQMVRRYQGMDAARVVFAKARRVLTGEFNNNTSFHHHQSEGTINNEQSDGENNNSQDEQGGEDAPPDTTTSRNKRWMVTNRLDPSVGKRRRQFVTGSGGNDNGQKSATSMTEGGDGEDTKNTDTMITTAKRMAGPITWHLYASHATMEHRLNHQPEIAARIYELGLRNHPQFLTKPPFVLKYAQLLLELNDTVNLRALLTRAVSAASDDDTATTSSKSTVAAVLWDMTLQFETILSGTDPMAYQQLQEVERKRHAALMGPDLEDVSTGGYHLDGSSSTTIGAQKSTISEMLVRNDGYDISSTLVNGMARSVSVLEVMGLWGSNVTSSGVSLKRSQPNRGGMDFLEEEDEPSERSGGASDASYQRRLLYQRLYESGVLQAGGGLGGVDGGAGPGMGAAGNKMLSARERLATAGGAGGAASNAAVNVAIQQQPEWIRHLLLMLPASKSRLAVLAKPPPHLVEMALMQLRQGTLPSERPQDENGGAESGKQSANLSGQKRKNSGGAAGGDSSDEEDNVGSGGYGMQFRSRQRARQMKAAGADTNGMGDGANQ